MSDLMDKTAAFFELFVAGRSDADQIDVAIDEWHGSPDIGDQSLAEFLGMTDQEYGLWAIDDGILPVLRAHRLYGGSLEILVAKHLEQLIAANNPHNATPIFALRHWVAKHSSAS